MQLDNPTPERERNVSRRGFVLGLLVGAGGAMASVLGFAGYQVLTSQTDDDTEPPEWQRVGSVDTFPPGETLPATLELPAGPYLIWVHRKAAETYTAFSSTCTHQGATVDWWPAKEQFICRVHGGTFDANGDPVAGPVPTALARHAMRINGVLVEVRTTAEEAVAGDACAPCASRACVACSFTRSG